MRPRTLDRWEVNEFDEQYGSTFSATPRGLVWVRRACSLEPAKASCQLLAGLGVKKPEDIELPMVDIHPLVIPAGFFTHKNALRAYSRLPITQRKRSVDSSNATFWTVAVDEGEIEYNSGADFTIPVMTDAYTQINLGVRKKKAWRDIIHDFTEEGKQGMALNPFYGISATADDKGRFALAVVGINGPVAVLSLLGGAEIRLTKSVGHIQDGLAEAVKAATDTEIEIYVR